MRFTWNWLKEFVEVEGSAAEVGERLTMAGLEVDALEEQGADLAGVICAEVMRVEKHPDADKLRVCEVRFADRETVTVVCGAPNVAPGQRVAFAQPGCKLPNGMEIAVAEVRGVASAGMLCAETELGIGDDAAGIMVLPDSVEIGASVAGALGYDDTVLELSITPNRGDCLSVFGIAREVAALTGARLLRPRIAVAESDEAVADQIDIKIDDPEGCRRYVGRVISGVAVGPSPHWMRARLRAVGVRPINNLVDVTNYVMMERGQPLHAFDYDRLPAPEITVRRAREGATFVTLDGQPRQLVADDLMITSGGQDVALAGVMGGENSEVTDGTTKVLLESAWFEPGLIRRTSKRLGLRSEASYRFERCTDLVGVPHAADRAAQLLAEIGGGQVAAGRCDAYPSEHRAAPISLRVKRIEELLGVEVSREDVVARLKAFAMEVDSSASASLAVVPPSYRSDLTREVDLIEEVARSIGYDAIPATVPQSHLDGEGHAGAAMLQRRAGSLMVENGFHEVVCASFASEKANRQFPGLQGEQAPVKLRNPLIQGEDQMRTSLLPGLLRVAKDNAAQGATRFAGYSIGKVYWRTDEGFDEAYRIGSIACPSPELVGHGAEPEPWAFADLKGVVESLTDALGAGTLSWRAYADDPVFHPGYTAMVSFAGGDLGVVGALHPAVAEELDLAHPCWLFELDLKNLLDYRPRPVEYEELPRFPVVVRDLAVVAEVAFESDRVVRFVQGWGGASDLIEGVLLFDQYEGDPIPKGKKSLAYSISYRAADRTLTDAEVNEVHGRLVSDIAGGLPVELR